MLQGRQWLPKTWGASSNAARRRCLAAPSILPKSGGVIAPLPPFIDAPANELSVPAESLKSLGCTQLWKVFRQKRFYFFFCQKSPI